MTTPISGQVIDCTQLKCVNRSLSTPATMLISYHGNLGKPTCESCARWLFDHDASGGYSLAPLGEYVDLFAEAKQAAFATPGQVISGEPAIQAAPAYQAAASTPAPAAAPAPKGFFAGLRQAWRDYRGWKTQLPADQRLGVEVAETAAAWGTWGAVHHWVKEDQRKTRESLLHIAPMNNVQAGMWRGEERREQQRVQQQQNQIAADLRQLASQSGPQQQYVPGPTQRSDIFGNFV